MHALASEALALAKEAADEETEASALMCMGTATGLHLHDLQLSRRHLEDVLALCRRTGRRFQAASCLNNLGEIPRSQGDYATAARYYQESLEIDRQTGDRGAMGIALFNLGEVAAAQQDWATATRYEQEGLAIAEELGYRAGITILLAALGQNAAAQADVEPAQGYLRRALTYAMATGSRMNQLFVLAGFARLKALAGEPVRAAEWVGLIQSHPSCETDAEQRSGALLAELRQTLPAAELEAALGRGKSLDLQTVLEGLAEEGS